MSLRQLIYVSALPKNQDPSCLTDILRESIANNKRDHVTGMLLYVNGSFMQVLEGDTDTLDILFDKICLDPRHTNAVKIMDIEIPERQFSEWSMGHADVTDMELDQIIGMNDFFSKGHCLTEIDKGIATRVLTEFREGLWRQRIRE